MSNTRVFHLEPLPRFASLRSAVRAPQELTVFSYNDRREYLPDDSSLRYYYTPALGTILSDGFESFRKHDDSVDEHLDALLRAIMLYEWDAGTVKADIITWRGMMTKIMSLPFDMRSGWEMNAMRFQGTIYIEENHAYKLRFQRPPDRRGQEMSYWGYKFEALATLPAAWDDCSRSQIEGRGGETVGNSAQFCSVVKTGFGGVRMVLGGEVDGIWDARAQQPHNYVELKTSKMPVSARDEVAFERKLQRIWAQSFLLGVPRVVVGFRDDDGVLGSVKEFETQGIPAVAKRSGRGLWDGQFSISFTTAVLEWLKEAIPSEEDGSVWRICHREGAKAIEVERTQEKGFLTEEFMKWRLKQDGGIPEV